MADRSSFPVAWSFSIRRSWTLSGRIYRILEKMAFPECRGAQKKHQRRQMIRYAGIQQRLVDVSAGLWENIRKRQGFFQEKSVCPSKKNLAAGKEGGVVRD